MDVYSSGRLLNGIFPMPLEMHIARYTDESEERLIAYALAITSTFLLY